MGRSRETFNKKEVRKKKEKKRKEKEQKRLARKENEKKSSLDDMIAYVDEKGNITDTPVENEKKEEIKPEDIEVSVPPKDESTDMESKREGKLVFFNDSKGYGFIKDKETQEKVFCHQSNFKEEIPDGSDVNFEVMPGKKGPEAVNVRLVEG